LWDCWKTRELMSRETKPSVPESLPSESFTKPPATPAPLASEQVELLYLAHGKELMRFLLGVLSDPAVAADCLQAVFTKLMQRGHETQPESRRAWLFKVAFHEAMLFKRRAATGDRVLRRAAWSAEVLVAERSTPGDEGVLRGESIAQVQAALEQLPPEQRLIVRMRIYDDKTFAEIAAELNIPLGTALGRMRGALIKLRKMLANHPTD
jgi:RNA polymerase sigma factor (sigma-70 family)